MAHSRVVAVEVVEFFIFGVTERILFWQLWRERDRETDRHREREDARF